MRNDFYPEGTVINLLETDLVTPATRNVLKDRFENDTTSQISYFNEEQFATLVAVCKRLVPQPERVRYVNLPHLLEKQLASGSGNGWRYASMPDDNKAMFIGLRGIEETAILTFKNSFHLLQVSQQDILLHAVQQGTAAGESWDSMPSQLFFLELLTQLVEIYYSHPLAKDEIGDVSFADAKGWQKLGLDQLEEHEPGPASSLHE